MADKKQFKFDDGGVLDWNSLCKKPLELYSNDELHKAYHYLWQEATSLKADLIHPYASMVSLELEKRSSKSSGFKTTISIGLSLIAIAFTFYFSWNSNRLTEKALSLSQNDAREDAKWMELQKNKFDVLNKTSLKEIDVIRQENQILRNELENIRQHIAKENQLLIKSLSKAMKVDSKK